MTTTTATPKQRTARKGRGLGTSTTPTPTARDYLIASMTEAQLQAAVIEWAQRLGYLVYHTYDSRRDAPGYPDLTLVHPYVGKLIFAELKSERGRLRKAQRAWHDALAQCYGVEVHEWRPRDLVSGAIEAALAAPVLLGRQRDRQVAP